MPVTSASVTQRAAVDRCPGVLRPHRAADGALLRLRLPGGQLRAQTLDLVSRAAARYADGDVQLTSRANLQLRGVATDDRGAVHPGLVDEIVAAGLLPNPSHERVRNIVCSPLTGRCGGLADLRPMVSELDARLCASPELAELPGPFLFVLDDGRGDVVNKSPDLGVLAVDAGSVRLVLGGRPVGPVVPLEHAAPELIDLALRFLPFTTPAAGGRRVWHVRELPSGGRELLDVPSAADGDLPLVADRGPRLGVLAQNDKGAVVSTLVPLGLLGRDQSAALCTAAGQGSGRLIITPWRGVLVPDLSTASADSVLGDLAGAGLGIADDTPWRGLTACTGAPRCASGRGDTRSLVTHLAWGRGGAGPTDADIPVHVVGCDRRCGSPTGAHIEVVTTGDRVDVHRVATAGADPALVQGALEAAGAAVQAVLHSPVGGAQ